MHFAATFQPICGIIWWYTQTRIRNSPQETRLTPCRKVVIPTVPGTWICPHPHECGNFQGHSPFPMQLSCIILYGRPLLIPFYKWSRNQLPLKYCRLNTPIMTYITLCITRNSHEQEPQIHPPPPPSSTHSFWYL